MERGNNSRFLGYKKRNKEQGMRIQFFERASGNRSTRANNQLRTGAKHAEKKRNTPKSVRRIFIFVDCGYLGIRPVLVVQNDVGNKYSPTVIAAAVTSKINKAKLVI